MTSERSVGNKVPAVTLGFWIIKIAATTLGETGGDAVTMTLKLGYLVGTAIFACLFVALVIAQIAAKRFHPFLYWAVIVATTTVGTTLADFCDRSLGIGYIGGSALLFALLIGTLGLWYARLGTVSVNSIHSRDTETFYLGDDPLFADAWHRARRFPRDLGRAGLWRWRASIRRGARLGRGAVFFHRHIAQRLVLGGLHPDAAARRHGRRFLGQAGG